MPVSAEDFRSALSRFASGVTVVTTKDAAGRFHGITVSAFCSVSLEPPLVLVCIEKTTGSHESLIESGVFTVNILSANDAQISDHFASLLEDKLRGIRGEIGSNGIPYLPNSLVNMECRLFRSLDGGDHTIFLGEVQNVTVRDGDPLVYFRSDYRTIAQ